jgi:hypothetical protein
MSIGPKHVLAQEDSGSAERKISENKQSIEELKGKISGLEESYLETKGTVDKLKKIKVSGYVQAQFRTAVRYDDATDTSVSHKTPGTYAYPVGDFAGGTFGTGVGSEFQIRRGRVKVAYESELTQAALQVDIVPFKTVSLLSDASVTATRDTVVDANGGDVPVVTSAVAKTSKKTALSGGGVSVKDAYLRFAEPWLKSFAVKAGIYDRPFGFEISYSSSSRESPERSRIFQTLFPGERDLGVSLEYQGSDNLPLAAQFLNLKVGLFTGNGINVENDDNRDVIGRLGFAIPLPDVNIAIDGGFSGYAGNVKALNDTVMEYSTSLNAFTRSPSYKKYDNVERQYVGGDLQLYFGNIPVIGGLCLRGEYIGGNQPATSSSTKSPSSDIASTSPVYKRNFGGYYAMLIQNVDPLKSQVVVKYDSYDPNTDVEGGDVMSSSEMAVNTLGLGLVYHWDENVKFIAYFDHVMNEEISASAAPFDKDAHDDVFTFRIQYKF